MKLVTGKKFSKPEMSRVINGDVELAEDKQKIDKVRLDHILVEQHSEYNRSTLQKFIKQGCVTVNGKVVKKPNTLILREDEVVLELPDMGERREYEPEVVFEDGHVLVLNKPEGLLSMTKGEYCAEQTLEDFGLLVHRLDRDTSGVVILAKDEATQKMLRKQFQDRKAHKVYYAVVEGRPKLDEALIDLPIARNMRHPTTFVVEAGGKPSQTHYKVIKTNDKYSLVELRPTTGRTHQLRVHMKYLGTPSGGDRVYGTAKPDTKSRLFLHAKELEITIPEGDRRVFEAEVPESFWKFFEE